MNNITIVGLLLLIVAAVISCNESTKADKGNSVDNGRKVSATNVAEKDLMFKDANRAVASAPEGVWVAFRNELEYGKKRTNRDDRMPYESVLRALEKDTLNVKQPYESLLISTSMLMLGKAGRDAIIIRGWVLPLYDDEKIINAWEVNMAESSVKEEGKWAVGMFGAAPVADYVEFEKAKGFWQSSYRKILFPDATLMGKEYVGYVESGRDLESGLYYRHKEKMDFNAPSLTWKQLLDQLCEDAEEKNQRVDRSKQLRRIVGEKEARNEK